MDFLKQQMANRTSRHENSADILAMWITLIISMSRCGHEHNYDTEMCGVTWNKNIKQRNAAGLISS